MITSTDSSRHRQVLDLAQPEIDVGGRNPAGVVAGLGDHLGGHVHADDAAGAPYPARRQEAVESGSATEVEHRLARAQRGDRLRVAAPEPEVRAIGDAGEIRFRVSHRQAAAALRAAAADAAAVCALGDLGVRSSNLSSDLIVVLGFHRYLQP
jgi:hypothetical protein